MAVDDTSKTQKNITKFMREDCELRIVYLKWNLFPSIPAAAQVESFLIFIFCLKNDNQFTSAESA